MIDALPALAQAEMIAAWQLLRALPDRERGWLASGGRGSLPAPVRERWLGSIDPELALELGLMLPDDAPPPRLQLGRAEVARVERAFVRPDCLAEAVPAAHRRLFMAVIRAKAGPLPGGFRWGDIGRALYGRDWATARSPATSDALRMRYQAALGAVGVRLVLLAAFAGEGRAA